MNMMRLVRLEHKIKIHCPGNVDYHVYVCKQRSIHLVSKTHASPGKVNRYEIHFAGIGFCMSPLWASIFSWISIASVERLRQYTFEICGLTRSASQTLEPSEPVDPVKII